MEEGKFALFDLFFYPLNAGNHWGFFCWEFSFCGIFGANKT